MYDGHTKSHEYIYSTPKQMYVKENRNCEQYLDMSYYFSTKFSE